MADCLTLLRQYNLQKKEIVERDGLIVFDQIAWPGTAKTNYLSYRYITRSVRLDHVMSTWQVGSGGT